MSTRNVTGIPPVIPVITNGAGIVETDFNFVLDDETEVYSACSLTFQNEHYVFGGQRPKQRQISKVTSCALKCIGTLAFNHFYADGVSVADQLIYLCFDYDDSMQCRVGSSPTGPFDKISESLYHHGMTRIATNDGE